MTENGPCKADHAHVEELYAEPRDARRRIGALLAKHRDEFGAAAEGGPLLFSAPGRTELGGNHTDHNNGKVLASAVQLDSLAAATAIDDSTVRLRSEGFDGTFIVDLDSLDPVETEKGTSSALIRGVAAGIRAAGGEIGGFECTVESLVLPGSGLSSSASFEVLVATILNHLYNDGRLEPVALAKIEQAAENRFFGKPCGLMDQIACSTGGIVAIDFAEPSNPKIREIEYSFHESGFDLVVVDTGGNHADLTPDYAAVPGEMQAIARFFGKTRLRDVVVEDVVANVGTLRSHTNDRAILRALHFYSENERVDEMVSALLASNTGAYLDAVAASGDSSWRLLQNCFTPQEPEVQGVTLALAITRHFLDERGLPGACRVHGGGFAGTIQAYVPPEAIGDYRSHIERIFGDGVVTPLSVRPTGAVRVTDD